MSTSWETKKCSQTSSLWSAAERSKSESSPISRTSRRNGVILDEFFSQHDVWEDQELLIRLTTLTTTECLGPSDDSLMYVDFGGFVNRHWLAAAAMPSCHSFQCFTLPPFGHLVNLKSC
mmetsp:Transcript_86698/g.190307  ORF Transcript_86698/g.190307 Transcript_86698/m.190307 type:complete len:119 (-) Transcript_86698:235-591(-)